MLADNDSDMPYLNSTEFSLLSINGFSFAVPIGRPSASHSRFTCHSLPLSMLIPY